MLMKRKKENIAHFKKVKNLLPVINLYISLSNSLSSIEF